MMGWGQPISTVCAKIPCFFAFIREARRETSSLQTATPTIVVQYQ
jgi:hypothetical protein